MFWYVTSTQIFFSLPSFSRGVLWQLAFTEPGFSLFPDPTEYGKWVDGRGSWGTSATSM